MRRAVFLSMLSLTACSEKETGPAAKTVIEVPDFVVSTAPADIQRGEALFAGKGCSTCHRVGGGKAVGPDLQGVTARRDEGWIKKMILRPEVMLKEDEVAKQLLAETFVAMPNQGVDPQSELPFLLSFLKSQEVVVPK